MLETWSTCEEGVGGGVLASVPSSLLMAKEEKRCKSFFSLEKKRVEESIGKKACSDTMQDGIGTQPKDCINVYM